MTHSVLQNILNIHSRNSLLALSRIFRKKHKISQGLTENRVCGSSDGSTRPWSAQAMVRTVQCAYNYTQCERDKQIYQECDERRSSSSRWIHAVQHAATHSPSTSTTRKVTFHSRWCNKRNPSQQLWQKCTPTVHVVVISKKSQQPIGEECLFQVLAGSRFC